MIEHVAVRDEFAGEVAVLRAHDDGIAWLHEYRIEEYVM